MNSWPQEILDLLDDPLFDSVRPRATRPSVEESLLSSLREVSSWVSEHGRLPSPTGELEEKILERQLSALRIDPNREALEAYDELDILSMGQAEVALSPHPHDTDSDEYPR
ncbi:hypothetical protein [uncultured Porphyromonas sp.]|uniref:hypothetical protein n=1 Tax=uncultured Porphyromonas sp. TaxID=159274 RepID=UPI00260F7598|nr:hypothetical protein [uncultured Porphyromonas sp.]